MDNITPIHKHTKLSALKTKHNLTVTINTTNIFTTRYTFREHLPPKPHKFIPYKV